MGEKKKEGEALVTLRRAQRESLLSGKAKFIPTHHVFLH